MKRKALLLFPPNWSACVAGPHLALPLLAGAGKEMGWQVEVWDLSEEFYLTSCDPPSRAAVSQSVREQNYDELDGIYFRWEDQLRALPCAGELGRSFGLLTGYSFAPWRSLPLSEVARLTRTGTPYTRFYAEHALPRLLDYAPSVVGITIASQEQIVPALELLSLVRAALPEAFLILGGNVLTRLRETTAFAVLNSLADQLVVFQGDMAFRRCLQTVGQAGVKSAREILPKVASDELIPYEQWPVPCFDGIALARGVGVPALPYVSTRGCYWGRCHFCAIPAGWSKKGYGGSAPAEFIKPQLEEMARQTGIARIKFVDEALAPAKARRLASLMSESECRIEWEAYARLETLWEETRLLEEARASGLRKLYFGLEQAPETPRQYLNKNDHGDPLRILRACQRAGISVHLFCMVGHPGTSRADAMATVRFLIEHQELVDTADLVGFRLDRGTSVPGVTPTLDGQSDWALSAPYTPNETNGLSFEAVCDLEAECQEELWKTVPRLLHPLYRIVGNWDASSSVVSERG
jgi:hypothetical protein